MTPPTICRFFPFWIGGLVLKYAFVIPEVIVLIIIFMLLWQLWKIFRQLSTNEDDPLEEELSDRLVKKLKILAVCSIIEATLRVISSILRYFT